MRAHFGQTAMAGVQFPNFMKKNFNKSQRFKSKDFIILYILIIFFYLKHVNHIYIYYTFILSQYFNNNNV